jgi:hypothetical protein
VAVRRRRGRVEVIPVVVLWIAVTDGIAMHPHAHDHLIMTF